MGLLLSLDEFSLLLFYESVHYLHINIYTITFFLMFRDVANVKARAMNCLPRCLLN